jgi:hypothetical protein
MHLHNIIEVLEKAIQHLRDAVESLKKADVLLAGVDIAVLEGIVAPPTKGSKTSASLKRSWERRKQSEEPETS